MFTLLVCYSSSEPVHAESTQAIGFPQFSVKSFSGEYVLSEPEPINEVLWAGIHKRLFLFELDAEDSIQNATNLYDMAFIDASDGYDCLIQQVERSPNGYKSNTKNDAPYLGNLVPECNVAAPAINEVSLVVAALTQKKMLCRRLALTMMNCFSVFLNHLFYYLSWTITEFSVSV
ncbi:hypothetical protein PVL29_011899 [Vitis rotundifolia]|uniref:Uncharacterized protein n=1 Tax=Vitis rotundifolia TaxID=103349 RepID=A0AA39DQ28_VITRO|nr:hypothetical protein PVL29_011899 [Vitis rotundifolia]